MRIRKLTLVAAAVALAAAACTAQPAQGDHVAPAACIEALDHADEMGRIAGEGFTILGDVLIAASALDVAEMDRLAAELEVAGAPLADTVNAYTAARDECRGVG